MNEKQMPQPLRTDILVVGAGAAGMMAAATAAQRGLKVLLAEKNGLTGKKLRITGKGRCNVTNHCDIKEFLQFVPTNPRFLYSCLSRFSPADTISFFERAGVPLKTERGRRVFPVSDKAIDITMALENTCKSSGVQFLFQAEVKALLQNNDGAVCGAVLSNGRHIACQAVILACGGKSYPLTGSNGQGYILAKQVGHEIIPPKAALVPVETCETWVKRLQGLALKNVTLNAWHTKNNKCVFSQQGEMLFTHFGISGPLVLSASSYLKNVAEGAYRFTIDLKPALSEEKLDARLLRDFQKNLNKDFCNALGALLPKTAEPVIVELSQIPPQTKVNQITKAQRQNLVGLLKALPLTFKKFRPIEEAIITSGGVKVTEIDPKTMQSKLCNGLYFAGELIDVDGFTGGFNLQIAFSTAFTAGSCVCMER